MFQQRVQIGGEGVVVVADGRLAGLPEAATVVGDHAVAGGEQHPGLTLPGVAVQRVAVDQHDRLPGAVVLVVDLDVGAVLGSDGDARHDGPRCVIDDRDSLCLQGTLEHPVDEGRDVDDRHPNRGVAASVREHQEIAVPHRPARVDDVGHVPVALVRARDRAAGRWCGPAPCTGSSRSSSIAPIEYSRTGPTPWVRTSQPAGGFDRGPAVAQLHDLPRLLGLLDRRRVLPVDQVGRRGDRVVLPIPARERQFPAVDPARKQRHALVLGRRTTELAGVERAEVLVVSSWGTIAVPSNAV